MPLSMIVLSNFSKMYNMFKAFIYSKLGDTLHHHTTFPFFGGDGDDDNSSSSSSSKATLSDLCSAVEYWIKLEPIYVKHPRIVLMNDNDDDYDDDESWILINKTPVKVCFDKWLRMPPGIVSITIQVPLLPYATSHQQVVVDPPPPELDDTSRAHDNHNIAAGGSF